MNTVQLILEEHEIPPSDLVYVFDPEDMTFDNPIEKKHKKYRKINLLSLEMSWIFERNDKMRGLSRKKKRKLNNRITRYYKNLWRTI